MANPISLKDGDNLRIGSFYEKVSSTLTAVVGRVITKATTGADNPVGHLGIATHVEDDPAAYTDSSSKTPLALIGGKRGSHVTVAAGDVSALQVDTKGAAMAQVAGATSWVVTDQDVTSTPSTFTPDATCQRLMIFNTSLVDTLHIRHATTVTTLNGWPIPPNTPLELWLHGSAGAIQLLSSGGTIDVRFLEMRG